MVPQQRLRESPYRTSAIRPCFIRSLQQWKIPAYRFWLVLLTAVCISPSLMGQALPTSPSQPGTFTIYGRIHSTDGTAAPRAVVRITGTRGMDRQVFCDDMGRYEFRDVPGGRYYVTAANRADSDQFTDPVEADTGRAITNRLLINIYLRSKATVTTPEERKGPVVSVAEATQQVPKNALKSFEQGVRQRAGGHTEKAIESFDKSIQLFPEYFQAYAERGHIRIATGQVAEAARDFAKALELDDHYEPALRGSGLCNFQQGKFGAAVQDLEKAIAIDPGIATSYLFLGVANLGMDQREQARLALQKALSIDPKGSARAHVHLANLHIRENRFQDAASELQLYLAAVPTAPDAEKLRAIEAQLRAKQPKD